jgi:hypothetical protein
MTNFRMAGGCQCGSVRYELLARPNRPCICHCRMCQKQFGNFFGAFAGVDSKHFRLTRGELAFFRSSETAERGFCRKCGTPLTFRYLGFPQVSVSIGSLDDHSSMKPVVQYCIESREAWLAEIIGLPTAIPGAESIGAAEIRTRFAEIERTNRQHPDHDTDQWPS